MCRGRELRGAVEQRGVPAFVRVPEHTHQAAGCMPWRQQQQPAARSRSLAPLHMSARYYVSLPANKAELWFAMEADRFQQPVFRQAHPHVRLGCTHEWVAQRAAELGTPHACPALGDGCTRGTSAACVCAVHLLTASMHQAVNN